MDATSKERELEGYFVDFPMMDSSMVTAQQQKDRYDIINSLIFNGFYDLTTIGKISALRRSALDDIENQYLKKYCTRIFDMAERYYASKGGKFRTNLNDFCAFYVNSKNGKKLYEKLYSRFKIMNYPLLLDNFMEEGFYFANSALYKQMAEYAKGNYNSNQIVF